MSERSPPSLALGGCDAQGCAAGCLADCLSDCASDCGSCAACDCSDCGCSLLPIPGGFPSGQDARGDQRLPNATQIRLSQQGLDFLEANLTGLVNGAVPGGLTQTVTTGVQGGGAVGTSVNVIICSERVLNFDIGSAGVFNGENATEQTFRAAASGVTVVAMTSPFGTTLHSGFSAHRVSDGVQMCSGGFLAPNGGSCQFNATAGTQYRVRATRAGSSVGPSSNVRVFAPAAGGCAITPTLGAADSPVALVPDGQFIEARVPLFATTTNSAGARRAWPMVMANSIIGISTGFQECTLDIDTRRSNPPSIPINVDVGIGPSAARPGYGALAIGDFSLDNGSLQVSDLSTNCNAFGLSPSQLVGIVTTFTGDPAQTVTRAIQQVKNDLVSLCQPALLNPTTGQRDICPSGSTARPDGNCHGFTDTNGNGLFDDGEPVSGQCVPQLLGAEVRVDMGDLLSSISPGLRAAVDVLFAVQDDAVGVGGGYTVPAYGGFSSLVQNSSCIDPLTPEELSMLGLDQPPTDVALASAFTGGADTHHIQVGLSERVMNWGAYQLWESGALCLQVTTRLSPLLSTSLFSLLIGSLKELTFPFSGSALGIALRPGKPPHVTLGAGTEEDPFVTIEFPELNLDFYVWTTERYARFMTFTADTTARINVPIDNGTLTPQILGVELANAVISNNELIREDPATITLAVEGVVPVALTMVSGALPSFNVGDLVASAGLPVGIEPLGPGTLRLVQDDLGGGRNERYLGVFVNLSAGPAPLQQRTDTTLRLVNVHLPDSSVFALDTFGVGERPSVELEMSASGPDGVSFEYQHRVDEQSWSDWSRSPYAVVSHDTLLLQGRHSAEARARIVGADTGVDLTPARVEFLIDVLAPEVETTITERGTRLRAADAVTHADALEFRYRALGDETWSSWQTLETPERFVAEAIGEVQFEVRDEAGNVGSNSASLRGLPPPSDGGGCGDCATGDASTRSQPLFGLGMLLLLAFAMRRRD
ncbi:MAG: MYXO-CTERM sorting domain-containing protein [Polyangiales bacterium]